MKKKPTVKQFPILRIDNKKGFKKNDFICPNTYGPLDKRCFKHKFKNGVEAIITSVSKFTYYRSVFDFQPFQKNIQKTHPNNDYDRIIQYSDEYKGFVTVFIKN